MGVACAAGTTAKEFGAAVSKSGKAAAANIKQRAQDAKTLLQDAGQDLLSGSRVSACPLSHQGV
jgi:hypothetical protein